MRKLTFSREKAIESGYDLADFVGDMALAYSPVMVFVIMAMATTSIALKGTLATNGGFTLAWAIATAVCVDGLWLGIWLKVRSYNVVNVATGFVYAGMWVLALFMFAIAACMSILITYQQVQGVTDELLAMHTLYIDPLAFIIARGLLVMLCATMAIFFRAKKQEEIAIEKKDRAKKVANISPIVTVQESQPLAIPELTSSQRIMYDALDIRKASRYNQIKEAMQRANEQGQKINLKAISLETGAGYSTVKLYAPDVKKELGIE